MAFALLASRRFVDQPDAAAANHEPVKRLAECAARRESFTIGHALWPRVQIKLHGSTPRNVIALSGGKPVEAGVVVIEHAEAMCDFVGPEVEVRNMSGKLMRIERDETRQLRRELLGDGDAVGREG